MSEPHTAEERRRLAREARCTLEERKAAREMAENKAERHREGGWAKERADRRTPEERARDDEEADALHERLRRETPFAAHHARKMKATRARRITRPVDAPGPGCRRCIPAWRTRRGDDDSDDHSLVSGRGWGGWVGGRMNDTVFEREVPFPAGCLLRAALSRYVRRFAPHDFSQSRLGSTARP